MRTPTRLRRPASGFGADEPAERLTPIIRDGLVFRRATDRSIWTWRGASDFALFQRFAAGEDVRPILRDRQAAGARLARVFTVYSMGIGNVALGPLSPATVPNFYGHLGDFLKCLADEQHGVELVGVADADQLGLDVMDHLSRVRQEIAESGHPQPFLELCNEPFKNGMSRALLHAVAAWLWPCMIATGDYDVPWDENVDDAVLPVGNYLTWHSDRDDEWPRSPRGTAEIRDGVIDEEKHVRFGGTHCPVIADEPMGASDTNQPGRRSNVPDDFRAFAACVRLMGNGATFHSDAGISSTLWTPTQRACAEAFFEGLTFATDDAQLAPYQRGARGGGAGVGNMPIEHHDLDEDVEPRALRTFAKSPYALAIRPSPGWSAVPRDGWRVSEEPWRGAVRLTR